MLYVRIVNGRAVEPATSVEGYNSRGWENRNDWKTMDRAEQIARELTESVGKLFLAIDSGPNVSPRFDVIRAPQVGDEVSKTFNGDSYPEGEIVKISASFKRIETSTGCVFFRRRQSGAWVQDRTWTLIAGHHYEQNPSF